MQYILSLELIFKTGWRSLWNFPIQFTQVTRKVSVLVVNKCIVALRNFCVLVTPVLLASLIYKGYTSL